MAESSEKDRKRAEFFENFMKPRQTETDLFSRMPEEVFADIERKLAEALPVYALGHPHPTVRRLATDLFEHLMIMRQ